MPPPLSPARTPLSPLKHAVRQNSLFARKNEAMRAGRAARRRSEIAYLSDEDVAAEESWLLAEVEKERLALVETEQKLEQLQATRATSERFWDGKVSAIEGVTEKCRASIAEDLEAIDMLRHPEDPDQIEAPRGFECLLLVESNWFAMLSAAIVIANLVTMFMEIFDKSRVEEFFLVDQLFLIFYVLELFMKAALFQSRLLLGPLHKVWWNWLDVIVVTTGVADMWLRPLCSSFMSQPGESSQFLKLVRMLRIARLFRLLKIVRIFLESDLSWTEGSTFQLFIMGVIGGNCMLMSLEVDYPDFFLWPYVEQALLMIFTFELFVRLRFWGCRFFSAKQDLVWNLLDFTIVLGGIADQWLMPTIAFIETFMGRKGQNSMKIGQFMVLLRMARLLRILRLVRLVRSVPPLFTLIVGILQAMQGMMWVLALTAVILYVFSLLAVKLIGHGLIFGGPDHVPDGMEGIFPNVLQSMFVLFMAMNGDPEFLQPMFKAIPVSKLFYVLYMILSSWAILSILTAVISENMISATETTKMENARVEEERALQAAVSRIRNIFDSADADGSGSLDKGEFYRLLSQKSNADEVLSAMDNSMTVDEVKELFESCTSLQDGRPLEKMEFIGLMNSWQKPVCRRETLKLENRLARLEASLMRIDRHMSGQGMMSASSQDTRTFEGQVSSM